MSLFQDLSQRGFINQYTNPDLENLISGQPITIYHGIDPTADSAHAGNMVVWMFLKHLANHGHKIIFLVGGGTGLIGDPKPDVERSLKNIDDVNLNVNKIKSQASDFFAGKNVEFVNNYDWLNNLSLIEFLRDIGKHFTINDLIKKEAIAKRLNSEHGISYTEFAYPLLQGFDFYQLFNKHNCVLQVGGSDQWGNMVAGVELVRKKTGQEVGAITVPLVIDKTTGKKFGKSEGNAVWLDPQKTTPFNFYQFWINVSDENVYDYLKLFTLLSLEEIESIRQKSEADPGKREAQKILAHSVTALVHNEANANSASKVSDILFEGKELSGLTKDEMKMLLETAPKLDVENNQALVDVLVTAELATSKREARTFIDSNAVTLAGKLITDNQQAICEDQFTDGLSLLKRGKKHIVILIKK
jgi:tyrosyl-tRNA synthetase